MSDWQRTLDALIDERATELIAVRRHLHAHPEPSGEERETTAYVAEALRGAGIEARVGPDGRGVLADGGDGDGDRVAVRADMDALRLHEVNEVPYRSTRPNLMHACGHDGHTATVLGAVWALHAAGCAGSLPWPVRWRGIFQPAEETGEGAREMMAMGALEGLQGLFSVHMDPSRAVGRIGVRYGALTANCDDLTIRVEGRGGHAARPHESLDPIAAAAQLVTSLYLFVPRTSDAQDPVVLTFGQFTAGDNANVIPEHALLRGTLRTLSPDARERTKQYIRQLAKGIAEASCTKIDVQIRTGCPSVQNDTRMTDTLREAAIDLLGEGALDVIPRPSMGGEDFAYYLADLPGAMFRLGCGSPEVGTAPLHSPSFNLDERALLIGAKVLARAVVLAARDGAG